MFLKSFFVEVAHLFIENYCRTGYSCLFKSPYHSALQWTSLIRLHLHQVIKLDVISHRTNDVCAFSWNAMESIYHLCGTLVKNSNLNKIMRGKNQINPNCGTCYKSNLDSKNATITKDKKKKMVERTILD